MEINLDLSDVEITDGLNAGPIQPGEYEATIERVELKTTRSGTGQYLSIMLRLTNNRVLFDNLNIRNESEKAQNIGRGKLKAILLAAGREPKLLNTDNLIGINCLISVGVKPPDQWNPSGSNSINAYKSMNEASNSGNDFTIPPWN